jgi:large subunit ribosomal protein L9
MPKANVTASGQPRIRRQVELMLTEDVEAVGKQGEIIRVKPGFARNYLLPYGLATLATEQNKRAVELHRLKLIELQKQKMQALQQLADRVSKYSVTLEANANEEGHLYGSILGTDISKALQAAGYAVDPDHVKLDGPLKELGMYSAKLQFHQDVKTEVKVWVVPAAKAAPATSGKSK